MQALANVIIRPARETYHEDDLGPEMFLMKSVLYRRKDLAIRSKDGRQIRCSWFVRENESGRAPVLVYCHGNCGNRTDAFDLIDRVLPLGVSLFCFDFCGSGNSDGTYISLGFNEQGDIECVVDFLRASGSVTSVSLWGRSMGAASILLYCAQDQSIASVILDSPYAELKTLCKELASSYKLVPKPLFNYLLGKVRSHILSVMGFDIFELSPVDAAPKCRSPALIVHAVNDDLISIDHMRRIYAAYGGPKEKIELDGGHNTIRPDTFVERACYHIHQHTVFRQHTFLSGLRSVQPGPEPFECEFKKPEPTDGFLSDFDDDLDSDMSEGNTALEQLPTMAQGFMQVVESNAIVPSKTRLIKISPVKLKSPELSDEDDSLFDCGVPNIPSVSIVKASVSFARRGNVI